MSFPFDATSRLVQQFRSLNEPITGLPNIVPVAVLSDYTRRSSSEQIESRALAGGNIAVPPGQFPLFQLFAPTRPLVVDVLRARISGIAGATLNLGITALPMFAPVGVQPFLDMGGVAATALLDLGPGFAPPAAALVALPLENGVNTLFPGQEPLRCLVPPSFSLVGGGSAPGFGIELTLLWREIIE